MSAQAHYLLKKVGKHWARL